MSSRTEHNNPKIRGSLDLTYHYEMLSDRARVSVFEQAIKSTCLGKRVLDCGCGTGIFSLIAARAGAEMVYGVDLDPEVLSIARDNVSNCGYHNIRLLEKDTRKLTLDDLDGFPVDVVICENLSTWQVTEPEISVLNHVNVNLISNPCTHLPQRVSNLLQPVESQFLFHELVELKHHYFQFTGTPAPLELGNSIVYNEVHFTDINLGHWFNKVCVEITRAGTLNSLRLTSPLVVHDGLEFTGSDTLMPPVIIPLDYPLPVQPGDRVEIEVCYHHLSQWSDVQASAKLV